MTRVPDIKSEDYVAFWRNERDKCKNGIVIDQQKISGLLYYHLNFFKCQIDVPEDGRLIRKLHNPYLRDNEWIIDKYITQAEQEQKGCCIAGSRRLAKSVFEASYITHRATFFKGTQNVISGLNEPDIKIITNLCDEALTNLPLPFKRGGGGKLESNWKKEVVLGTKSINGEREVWSTIPIRNLDGGKNTEALAGLSPFSLIIEEAGKGLFLDCLSAAIPSFATPFGWRCSPLILGTGGAFDKADDFKKMFEDPSAYNFLAVDLPEEGLTRKSVFISGHYAHDFPKDDTPLNEYLGIPTKEAPNLNKINIQVTNFERAERMIDEERDKAKKDRTALLKLTMYHPKNSYEVFLSDSNNNFPIPACKAQQKWIKENYTPLYIDLYRKLDATVDFKYSNNLPIDTFPVTSEYLANWGIPPVVVFEQPDPEAPFGTYCIGYDPYNEDQSSDKVNSLGSFCVYKRFYKIDDPWGNKRVASWAGRCKTVGEFHELCVMIAEYYNALEGCLPENEDKTMIQYFLLKKKGHYFAKALDLSKEIKQGTKTNRLIGLAATTPNQRYYMDLATEEAKEEYETIDETGMLSLHLGVSNIYDPMLLEEYIQYKGKPSSSRGIHDGNFDRVISSSLALTLAKYYDIKYPVGEYKPKPKIDPTQKQEPRIHTFFGDLKVKPKSPFAIDTKRKRPPGINFI